MYCPRCRNYLAEVVEVELTDRFVYRCLYCGYKIGYKSKQTVEKFIQTLDAEVTEMLKRKLVKFEKIEGEK